MSARRHALAVAVLPPRLLTREGLSAFLGGDVSDTTLWRWVKDGLIPKPVTGTNRWDRVAVERALDRASGLVDAASSDEADLIARAKQWGASA